MLANIVVACFTPVEVASLMTHDDWRVRLPLGIKPFDASIFRLAADWTHHRSFHRVCEIKTKLLVCQTCTGQNCFGCGPRLHASMTWQSLGQHSSSSSSSSSSSHQSHHYDHKIHHRFVLMVVAVGFVLVCRRLGALCQATLSTAGLCAPLENCPLNWRQRFGLIH